MKLSRFAALLLSAALTLSLALPVRAAEGENWLVPPTQKAVAFTDTAGTICEQAAAICCRTGLMAGVDARHFYPESGLTHAQITVIAARLHKLLSGSTASFTAASGEQWWSPCDVYLRREIPALISDKTYAAMTESPTASCTRGEFFTLLALVLSDTSTSLPVLNTVTAVPDCQDEAILNFYRWGVLSGKDEYGTLEGSAPLTRAAAAAMLARLIDPAQRLTLNLKPLDLCRSLLGAEPETVILTIGSQNITVEQFAPTIVSVCSVYNQSHFGSMSLEMSGRTVIDEAVDTLRRYVHAETLAAELGLKTPVLDVTFADGYRGLTAAGQTWRETHIRLVDDVTKALGRFPGENLPTVTYAPAWDTLKLKDLSTRVAQLPYWGGTV